MNIDFESRNITRRSFLKGAGVVGAAGLLSACGGSKSNNSGSTAASGAEAPNSTGATPLKEYISWESANREVESWNLLYSQTLSDANVVTNLWDGLMSFDCYGKLVPPSPPAGRPTRTPPSGPSTCATMWTGWTATAR